MFSAKLTCELSVSSKCWLNFFLPYPQTHLQNLHLIMELLYWLSEGGDSEDREIQLLIFGISRDPFNLDAEDMEQSSTQEV